ncbi:MAG: thioesterase family protein [Acidobacteriota bacterium]
MEESGHDGSPKDGLPKDDSSEDDVLAVARRIFQEKVPFHRTLGFEIAVDTADRVALRFDFRQGLIGNPVRGALHGGVISAALDSIGGLVAFVDQLEKMPEASSEEKLARLRRIGTVDLRVDYLRSGVGEYFLATGEVLRAGNKVVVTRMELCNDAGTRIAVGTGTYLVS